MKPYSVLLLDPDDFHVLLVVDGHHRDVSPE